MDRSEKSDNVLSFDKLCRLGLSVETPLPSVTESGMTRAPLPLSNWGDIPDMYHTLNSFIASIAKRLSNSSKGPSPASTMQEQNEEKGFFEPARMHRYTC